MYGQNKIYQCFKGMSNCCNKALRYIGEYFHISYPIPYVQQYRSVIPAPHYFFQMKLRINLTCLKLSFLSETQFSLQIQHIYVFSNDYWVQLFIYTLWRQLLALDKDTYFLSLVSWLLKSWSYCLKSKRTRTKYFSGVRQTLNIWNVL